MLLVQKRMYRFMLVFMLAFILIFTQTFSRAHAFLPIALAGLSLGQALYYTAAIAVTGYAAWDIADKVWDDITHIPAALQAGWNNLSSTAKAAWASAEEIAVTTGKAAILTAEMWMDSIKAGIRSMSGTKTAVPAYDFPGTDYRFYIDRYGYYDDAWVARYGMITFTINGEVFSLVPTSISKDGSPNNYIAPNITYEWALKTASGWTVTYTVPGSATAFNREMLVVTGAGTQFGTGLTVKDGYAWKNNRDIVGLGFSYPNWKDALIGWQDAAVAMKLYLQAVYGGTAVSAPMMPGIPSIPWQRDITKPVAIPIPPGVITYPQTGTKTGTLELTPDITADIITDMVGTANPGLPPGGGPPPKDDWPDSLGKIVTTRFPFSLPWDLYAMMALLNAPAKTPVFKVDEKFMGMDFKFEYSLAWLDPYMPWFRGILIIGFVIYLIQSTRNLLGGAK